MVFLFCALCGLFNFAEGILVFFGFQPEKSQKDFEAMYNSFGSGSKGSGKNLRPKAQPIVSGFIGQANLRGEKHIQKKGNDIHVG